MSIQDLTLLEVLRSAPALNSAPSLRIFNLVAFIGLIDLALSLVPGLTMLPMFTFLIDIASHEGNSFLALYSTTYCMTKRNVYMIDIVFRE